MKSTRQSGFIKLILLVIVVILILSYFDFNLRNVVNSPAGQDNFSYLREIGAKIWSFGLQIWGNYLREPVMTAWNFIGTSFGQIKSHIK